MNIYWYFFNSLFVCKGDNPQDSTFKLWDSTPESPAIAFLRRDFAGISPKPECTTLFEDMAF